MSEHTHGRDPEPAPEPAPEIGHELEAGPERELEALFDAWRSQGDVTALARAFDSAAPELLAIARFLARNEAEAEDFVQATFLAAIERAETFDSSRNWIPWLVGILARHARKQRRNAARVIDGSRVTQRQSDDPSRDAENVELHEALDRAVASLPETYARPLRMHLEGDLSPREIAAELALAAGTVRVRLHRGLRMLRETLPPGFALGVVAMGSPPRGLGAVRAAVIDHATSMVGKTALVSAGSLGVATKWLFAAVIALVVAGSAWLARPLFTTSDEGQLAAAPQAESTTAKPSAPQPALIADSSSARESVLASESRSQTASSLAGVDAKTRIVGRLLRPDSGPAVGAELVLTGRVAMATEKQAKSDWKDPAPFQPDVNGRFELAIVAPRGFYFTFHARLAGCADLEWQWNDRAKALVDLGETRFSPACTLLVRVVDAAGAPMEREYSISAAPVVDRNPEERESLSRSGAYDPKTHECRLEGLPEGRVTLEAHSPISDRIPPKVVEAKAGAPMRVDIVDPSPAHSRIVVNVETTPFQWFTVDPARVRLVIEGAEPRVGHVDEHTGRRRFVFDDVTPGAHAVEIDDPQFEHWTRVDVHSGDVVRAKLNGSAALHLDLSSSVTKEAVEPAALRIQYLNTKFTPAIFDLLRRGRAAPKDASFAVVPGECELVVEADGFPQQSFALGQVVAGEKRDVVVELKPGLAIRGRILAGDGQTPNPDIEVQLTRGKIAGLDMQNHGSFGMTGIGQIPNIDAKTRSGADGTFSFEGFAAGTLTVRAVFSPWLIADATLDTSQPTPATIDLVEPPSGFLEGRLLLPDGARHDGIEMELYPEDHAVCWPAMARGFLGWEPSKLPADGRFRFGPLPVRRLLARLSVTTIGPSGETGVGVTPVPFIVEGGRTTHLDIDWRATMRGRVSVSVFIDGVAATGGFAACMAPTNEADRRGGGMILTGNGTALIGGIEPGPLRLWIDAEDRSWTWQEPETLDLAPGQQLDVEARIDLAEHNVRFLDARDGTLLALHDIEAVTGNPFHEYVSKRKTDERGISKVKLPSGPVTFRDPTTNASATLDWGRDAASPLEVRLKTRD